MKRKSKNTIFKAPKNNHGFISYHTFSGKPMKAKTIKDLYGVLIPICVENDRRLLIEMEK
jgi:hypothetical protein